MRSGFFAAAASSGSGPGAPGVVTNVVGTRGVGKVDLTWTAPVSNGGSAITDYVIQYSSDSGSNWTTFADGTLINTFTSVNGLSTGTLYTFRVLAKNAIGDGPYSTASTSVAIATVPGAPTNVVGTPGAGQVSLTWNAPADNGGSAITDYVIQYSSDSGSNWDTAFDGSGTDTSKTITGLDNGTSYTFRIAAVNLVDPGDYSTASTAVTTFAVPGAPTNVVGVSAGATSVSLTWSAPTDNGGTAVTDYYYQYSSDSGATWSSATFAGSTSAGHTVTGLTAGTSYTFRVAAGNMIGIGSYSTASAAVTPAAVPSAPSAPTVSIGTGSTTIDTFSWVAPASNGSTITKYGTQTSTDNGSTWATEAETASLSRGIQTAYTASSFKLRVRANNAIGWGPYSVISTNGTGAWSSVAVTEAGTCPDCPACPECASCAGGCDSCGTRTITGSPGTITGSKGTSSKTCYKWTRSGNTETAATYNQNSMDACTATFSTCTAGTCGCTAGTCGCSACSDSWQNYIPEDYFGACVLATGTNGANSGYYSLTLFGWFWNGNDSGCNATASCNFGGGIIGANDVTRCSTTGQYRANTYACILISGPPV